MSNFRRHRCRPASRITGWLDICTTAVSRCNWSNRPCCWPPCADLIRPADLPPLPPIRSLAYFQPVIEELLVHPMPDNYLEYLRLKLNRIARNATPPAEVQKTTISDDR